MVWSSAIALSFILALSDTVTGFSISGPSIRLRTSAVNSVRSNFIGSLKASAASDSRRDFLFKVAAFTAGTLTVGTSTQAFEYDTKEGDAARAKYLEDVKSMKQARWTRQVCKEEEKRLPDSLNKQAEYRLA
jgi:hypothetical protein